MHLKRTYLPNGETIAHVTLFGANRDPRVREWHEKVMVGHFGIPVTYIQCPFETGVSHGRCMDEILGQVVNAPVEPPTYIWWWDNDCIALKREVFDHVIDTVCNKQTLWGQAWNSSHIKGPNGSAQHPYASQACLCLSLDLYRALGSPSCDWSPRGDTAEELSYLCEERGYTLALQYPSHSDEPYTVALSQSCRYGRSIIYGPNLTYHETRADLPEHTERFVAMAQLVIEGKLT